MPEGPEIRLAADQLESVLKGCAIDEIYFAFEHLKEYSQQLNGRTITQIETRGKAILTCFDNDWLIYSHNQLYGRWITVNRGQLPKTNRQLRLALHTRDHSALLYSASDIEVIKRDQLEDHPFISKLGPDILSEHPSVQQIVARLKSPRFQRRQLASLMLDQHFLAGLGNYLRAEVLFFARLHPQLKPSQCSDAQLKTLANKILGITQRAYKTKGITNPPSLVKTLKSQGRKHKESYRFSAYGRGGKACYECGHKIDYNNAGGRKMYFCPSCQPLTPQ